MDPMQQNSYKSTTSNGFPKIQKNFIKDREHETVSKLKGSFVGENVDKLSPKSIFSPPNITAFNQQNVGLKGSLFNEQNQRMTMDQ